MKKIKWIVIIIDILAIICFILFYGPWSAWRDYLVTTAMNTMTHKYLARTFYTDEMIDKVMMSNYTEELEDITRTDDIVIGGTTDNYSSVYERQILEHEEDELYKIITFKHNGYNVYVTAIYDPSRVSIANTSFLGYDGELVRDIAKKNNALVAINGGGFQDDGGEGNGGTPTGIIIKNSEIVWGNRYSYGRIIGFNKDNILILGSMTAGEALDRGVRDAIEFGPYLIVNGVPANIYGNGGYGINPRSAIAQRKDGVVLFVIVDGKGYNSNWSLRGGVGINDLITILLRYGAYNAANLDGGASSTLVVNGKLYNKPCGGSNTGERKVPNAWIMK